MADSPDAAPAPAPLPAKNPIRRLYHWILSWAHHPMGTWALSVFAFLDSSVFPVPPLFLQVALSLERPRRSFWYAFVDTAASVAGAVLGYFIGYALWDAVGVRIVGPIPEDLRAELQGNAFAVTLVYSFIPLPYKLITIGSGLLHLNLATLLVASTIGRSFRFFLLAALCFFAGRPAKHFIEKYFNWVCLAVGAFVAAVLLYLVAFVKKPGTAEGRALKPLVEDSTGWTFTSDPAFEKIDRKGLEAFLSRKLEGRAGQRAAAGGRALRTLGLLPSGYSIVDGMKRMYKEEVLALYDPATRKILLVREALDRAVSGQAEELQRRTTIAHEMVHALQHQHTPDFAVLEAEDEPDLDDVQGAVHAFMEGEATVQMYAAVGIPVGPSLYSQVLAGMDGEAARKFPSDPPLMKRLLLFPYIAGTGYFSKKAPSGVKGLAPEFHAALPLSTERLLHPERTDPPLALFLPDLSASIGGGRRRIDEAVLGEKFLAPLFGNDAGPASPLEGALRWGGDRLQLYETPGGTDPVVVLVTEWDTASSALLAFARTIGRGAVWDGRRVAIVAGLPAEAAIPVAREALGRAVASPFRTVGELRRLRASLALPATAAPAAEPERSAVAAIAEAPGQSAAAIPHHAEIVEALRKASASREDARRTLEALR